MNHIFITNNFGKRDPYEITNEIFKYCVQNNMEYEIIRNRDDLSTEDIVRKYAKEGNVIYAVGGDGMINKVLNGVVNTGASLGFIPYGTGNDFNRVMEKLDDGSYNVNVGKINDKFFINVACFGIDADISNDERFIHNEFIPVKIKFSWNERDNGTFNIEQSNFKLKDKDNKEKIKDYQIGKKIQKEEFQLSNLFL